MFLDNWYKEELKKHMRFLVFKVEGLEKDYPPLVMYANPEKLSFKYAKNIASDTTFGGKVYEYWIDKLTAISASGISGNFFTERSGIAVADRHRSLSFKAIEDLYALYRDNAVLYSKDAVRAGVARVAPQQYHSVVKAGIIKMFHCDHVYHVHFDNFNLRESSTRGVFSFDFSLSVYRQQSQVDFSMKNTLKKEDTMNNKALPNPDTIPSISEGEVDNTIKQLEQDIKNLDTSVDSSRISALESLLEGAEGQRAQDISKEIDFLNNNIRAKNLSSIKKQIQKGLMQRAFKDVDLASVNNELQVLYSDLANLKLQGLS